MESGKNTGDSRQGITPMMNYSKIKYFDIANGVGCRTSLFVSGCTHHCKGCFNEETWDFNFGKPFTDEVMEEIISSLRNEYISGLTILGGEPMEAQNQPYIKKLISRMREEVSKKDIWIYSGYTLEELLDRDMRCYTEYTMDILKNIDILVDGRFILEKKNLSLAFRGSSNQRILDMGLSLTSGKAVLSKYMTREIG